MNSNYVSQYNKLDNNVVICQVEGCGSTNMNYNNTEGRFICIDCGAVQDRKTMKGKEYFTYDEIQSNYTNYTEKYANTYTTSTTNFGENFHKTELLLKMSSKDMLKLSYMADSRVRNELKLTSNISKEKIFKDNVYNEIEELCSHPIIHLESPERIRASYLLNLIYDTKLYPKNVLLLAAVIVMLGARLVHSSITYNDILKVTNNKIKKKDLFNWIKQVRANIYKSGKKLSIPIMSSQKILTNILNNYPIKKLERKKAMLILKRISKHVKTTCQPNTSAAVAFIIMNEKSENPIKISRKEICEKVKATLSTVEKRIDQYIKYES